MSDSNKESEVDMERAKTDFGYFCQALLKKPGGVIPIANVAAIFDPWLNMCEECKGKAIWLAFNGRRPHKVTCTHA